MDEFTTDTLTQIELDASLLAKKNKYALIDLHHQLIEMSQIIQNSIRDEENAEKVLGIQVILGDKVQVTFLSFLIICLVQPKSKIYSRRSSSILQRRS
jgi:hypothetical protein